MRWTASLLFLLLASAASAETVTVSAAISLKDSLDTIEKSYEAKSGDYVTFNFDASGKLAQQIRQGAPVDLFISADNDQVNRLIKSGDADASTRRLIVRNTLVLIVPAGQSNSPKSFADLASGHGKIAIGDSASVPVGRYATQSLKAAKIYDAVAPRLVLAENVRQVLTYVQRGEVEAGIVYGTDAKVAGISVKIVAVVDPATHDAIEYPAVITSHAQHAAAAVRFLDYLQSKPSRKVFEKFGFELPHDPTSRPVK